MQYRKENAGACSMWMIIGMGIVQMALDRIKMLRLQNNFLQVLRREIGNVPANSVWKQPLLTKLIILCEAEDVDLTWMENF